MSADRSASRNGPSRRGLLKAGLAAGAVAGTGAWGSAPGGAAHFPRLRQPGSLPYPRLPMGTDTIPQIEHIVVLMMENHSYDNRLGMLRRPGADGFRLGRDGLPLAASPYANGDVQHAFRMPTTCQNNAPSQDWLNSHIQFDNGRNDGFVESGSGPVSMGYWERADQPFYYSMASVFPIADRYFCSVLGQTYPNRRFLISATSLGIVNDTVPALTDYPPNGTIFDKVAGAGISWRDYYTDLATVELYPELYLKNLGTNVVPIADFFADAAAGTLPGLALVEPNYDTQSEEDPQNIVVGEAFAASVVNAVMTGPAWRSTLLIWTYDEHGGYFDHVPPPPALAPDDIAPEVPAGESAYNGFGQYGFRVPMAVISPWARRHYVSHQIYDHTSICALVEAKWNLPAMTYRDANAGNLVDMVDLRFPAFLEPPRLAQPLLDTDPASLTCSTTGPGTIPPPGSVTPPR
ncbi:MAG TPA: alkaline phosphatase family protein [Streptosporangiaceae bacterium]|nr:alkaline phosphatase family protein [Streptosporangiaceae bacterium]